MTVTKKDADVSTNYSGQHVRDKGMTMGGEGKGEDKEHPPFVDPPCALMYEVSTNKTSKWGWSKQRRYWVKL